MKLLVDMNLSPDWVAVLEPAGWESLHWSNIYARSVKLMRAREWQFLINNTMNQNVVLFHLREAAEQLNETIQSIASNGEYGAEEFQVDMGHLYHHLNTAWNGRDQTDEQHQKCTDADFARFRKFPNESELFLD